MTMNSLRSGNQPSVGLLLRTLIIPSSFRSFAHALILFFSLFVTLTLSMSAHANPVWQTGASNQTTGNGSSATTSATLSINKPANVQAGDLVIVTLHYNRTSLTISNAQGFTQIRNETSGADGNSRATVAAFYKIASASEPASYTFTYSGITSTTTSWRAVAQRVTGHHPTTPIGNYTSGNSATTTQTTRTLSSINTTANNSLLVAAITMQASSGTISATPGTSALSSTSTGPSFNVAYQTLATAGATGNKTWTWTTARANAALMFIINPAPTVDYGDAPATYGNASHTIVTGIKLGANAPDSESASQPTHNATGDGDDEDGAPKSPSNSSITLFPLLKMTDTSYSSTFTVTNTAGTAGKLYGWIDFDKSGMFEADEATSVNVPTGTNGGTVTLAWNSIPTDIQPGTTFIRLRMTTDAAVTTSTPTGSASNDEVEDFPMAIALTLPPNSASVSVTRGVTPTSCTSTVFSENFNDLTGGQYFGANRPGSSAIRNWVASGGGTDTRIRTDGMYASTHGTSIYMDSGAIRRIFPTTANTPVADANGLITSPPTAIELRDIADDQTPGVVAGDSHWGPQPPRLSRTLNTIAGQRYRLYFELLPENNGNEWRKGMLRVDTPSGSVHLQTPSSTDSTFQYQVDFTANATSSTISFVNYSRISVDGNWCIPASDAWCTIGGLSAAPKTSEPVIDNVTVALESACLPITNQDYGDAPASYGNPSHTITPNLAIGNNIDADNGTQQNANADADDTNGSPDDEDGLQNPAIIPTTVGQTYTLTTYVKNETGSTAYLTAYIDFNRDGDFSDPGERADTQHVYWNGSFHSTFTIPAGTTAGTTYARLRLSQTKAEAESPLGAATSGEVEDHKLTISAGPFYDFGDAPVSYGNPRHTIVNSIFLGTNRPDSETGSQHSYNASGDGVDEDGAPKQYGNANITLFPILKMTATSYSVDIKATNTTGSAGKLYGWIDLDQNGTFDADEAASANVANNTNGTVTLTWNSIPTDIKLGTTFIRLRLTTDAAVTTSTPANNANDGEVEDFPIAVAIDVPPDSPNVTIVRGEDQTCSSTIFTDNFDDLASEQYFGANISATPFVIRNWTATGGGSDTYARTVEVSPFAATQGRSIYFGNGMMRRFYPDTGAALAFDGNGRMRNPPDAVELRDDVDDISPSVNTHESHWGPEPVTLSRTFASTAGQRYRLYFSAVPEGGEWNPGIMRVDTPSGSIHFKAPGKDEGIQKYRIEFTAIGTSSTIRFVNYGHIGTDNGYCDPNSIISGPWCTVGGFPTDKKGNELIIDDVAVALASACPSSSISGSVYTDTNGNNAFDTATETGLANISVSLYDNNGTTATTNDDSLIATTSTAANGAYSFTSISSTPRYRVEVDIRDTDLPASARIGTTNPLADMTVAAGSALTNQNFGFDLACNASAGQFGGIAFRDYNQNGMREPQEEGIAGITVTAYNSANAVAATGTTDARGWYTLSGLTNGTQYRLEYTNLPNGLYPGAAGTDTASTVRFVTASGNCATNLGVSDPIEYCEIDPSVAASNFVNGNPSVADVGNYASLFTFPYNATGDAYNQTPAPVTKANTSQTGALWGMAYQKTTRTLFASAAMRRFAGFGTLGTGGIYKVDMTDPNAAYTGATPYVDLRTIGIDTGNDVRVAGDSCNNLASGPWSPSRDVAAWDKVGKVGVGDIDYDERDNRLWLVNLNDRKLYGINNVSPTTTPTAGSVLGGYAINLPSPYTCASGTFRPWAVKYHRGYVYVGGVCDAASDPYNLSKVRGYVLRFDPANTAAGFSHVKDFALNQPRQGFGYSNVSEWSGWLPQADAVNVRPQFHSPIVGNLEFDTDGSIIVGIIDRAGLQKGTNAYDEPVCDDPTQDYSDTMGDVLRLCKTDTGYLSNAEPGCTTVIPTNSKTTDEYYWGDLGPSNNAWEGMNDIAAGGLALAPGKEHVLASSYDANSWGTNGVVWLNNRTGAKDNAYSLSWTTLGKSTGMGELEVLCDPAPTEVGNRVWLDTDKDGLQDAGEAGINNVNVTLTCGSDSATTITNTNGEYYFSNAPGKNATFMGSGESCSLSIANAQASLSGYTLTTQNADSKTDNNSQTDIRDSDAAVSGSNAVINFTVGSGGQNNHGLDFGYKSNAVPGTITGTVYTDSNTNDTFDAGTESGISSITVTLLNAANNATVATTSTAADGTYNFSAVDPALTYNIQVDTADTDLPTGSTIGTLNPLTNKTVTAGGTLTNQNFGFDLAGNRSISGKVFEDKNYGGSAGRPLSTSGTAGILGVRVELYNSTGGFVTSTTTADGGPYSFTNVAAGNYYVRVVNDTIRSTRAGSNASERGIQTFRSDGTSAATNEVGGRNPAVVDSGANTTNQTLNTATFMLSGGGQAQSVQPITVTSSDIANANFGFNFSTVVNTNDSGQGSLRQGILNINLLANTGLAQAGQDNTYGVNPGVIKEVLLFNIPAASDPLGRTDICGGSTCKITINTQLPAVALEPAIIDATTQPGYVAGTPGVPRIHIVPTAGLDARGFTMGYDAPDSTLRGFAITGFRNLLTNRGITVDSERTLIESNYIGVKPDGTADGNGNGIELQYTQSAVIGGTTAAKRNIISANKRLGIFFNTGASGSVIQNNFIGTNPAGTAAMGNETTGIDTEGGSGTKILDNVIAGNPYQGIELGFTSGGPGTANAIIQGNRIGVGINGEAIGNGTGIINYGVSNGHTIGGTGAGQANIIAHNLSNGISFYNNNSSGITISANSIYANGGLGIDLGFNGITVNDANDADAGANNLLNFPLLSNISISGSNLVITGCAPAGATVELFEADVSTGGKATPGTNKFSKSKDYGEGQTYLTSFVEGSAADTDSSNCVLATDADGNNQTGMKAFSVTIPAPPSFVIGDTMTATATVATVGTSEFSPVISLTVTPPIGCSVLDNFDSTSVETINLTTAVPGPITQTWNANIDALIGGSRTLTLGPAQRGTATNGYGVLEIANNSSTAAPMKLCYNANGAGLNVNLSQIENILFNVWEDEHHNPNAATRANIPMTITLSDGFNSASLTQDMVNLVYQQLGVTVGWANIRFPLANFSNINNLNRTNVQSVCIEVAGKNGHDYSFQKVMLEDTATCKSVSGKVFEDVNYGGGVGRAISASGTKGTLSTLLELYDHNGRFIENTATDSTGSYTFPALLPGNYYTRVVSSSVNSTRSGTNGTELGITTYRTDGVTPTVNQVGGRNPSTPDADTHDMEATLNTSTFQFIGGALNGKQAQVVQPITLAATNLSGVDFGFNFSTVVNANDTGQGSLRQVIANANLLANTGMAQPGSNYGVNTALNKEVLTFNIPASGDPLGRTDICGSTTCNITVNSQLPDITAPLIIDGTTQPGYAAGTPGIPRIRISPVTGLDALGISIAYNAPDSTVRGLSITGFRTHNMNRAINVAAARTVVESNYIGVKPDGTADANGQGIMLEYADSATSIIGGTTPAKRNIISGNLRWGIAYNTGATAGTIQNNFIGTNVAGTAALGNQAGGIDLESANDSVVLDNVIAGNAGDGIQIGFTNGSILTSGYTIRGNRIGVGINGEAIGNTGPGIMNYGGSSNHQIGGTAAGQANIIANNTGGGIKLAANTANISNVISGNSIYANGGLGIDLGNNGVTVNDASDADAGANDLLNFPTLSEASMIGGNLTVKGCAPTGTTVELFEADVSVGGKATPGDNKFGKSKDYGEGQTYLASFVEGSASDTDSANCTLPTDADGNNQTGMKAFSVTIPAPPGFVIGDTMTATATISTAGTSEFSPTILLLEVRDIAGKVYEDVNYGGGNGRAFNAGQSMAGINAATIELRDTSNNLLASTTTAADGNYTFTSVPVGTYNVQVVNSSVRSTRPGSNGSERGVITYRTDGAGNTVNVAGTTFSQTITLSTTNLSNVNFGFNFDTVTNTNDSGAGSLRQFLINANLLGGDATLAQVGRTAGKENAILELSTSDPNYTTGYWSIPLQSALPSITAPIVLDASLPPGSNSNPILELKGTNAGSGANGLTLGAGSNASTIRKLAITGFAGSGIYIDSSNHNSLLANHIGITPSGITRANTGSGIRINAASSNKIGGVNDGEGNLITNNGGSGIAITDSGSMFNSILGNSIYANAELGIDLIGGIENSFGVTANDEGDVDSGPNSLINYPDVKVNSFGANGTKIVTHDFNLDLAAGDYRLEFFVSTAKDASGNGEGQTFIGSKDLSHPGTGSLNFKGTLNAKIAVAKGAHISATLTQKTGPTTYGSTSEFSGIRDGITTQVCDSLIDDTTSGSNMVIDETDLTTVIKLLEAKDSNGNPITYVISGGADGNFFTITNPAPGATLDCATIKFLVSNIIITKSALADNEAETRAIVTPGVLPLPGNYELPMDKDKDNVYDLQITATTVDGKKYVRNMNVRVMDTNEAPNITSATALTLTEDSNAEVLSVKAQDADANEKLSYRISAGADSSHFEINATTGLLRFRAIPDYDAPMDTNRDNLYEVEVTVTDKGGLTNSKLFKISIVNNTADDGVVVNVRALLQGAYNSNTALMSADLNTLGLLPNKQPYQYAPFNHAGTETLSTMLKETTGNNAVVDWALVDLRTSVNTIVASRAVMLQRDGDLVDSQTGSANLHFANIKAGNYYISVRHRNHLGVMSASPVSLDNNAKLINFAASSTAVKGEETRVLNGKAALIWAGDINGSNTLTANGPSNDVTSLLSGVITSMDNLQGNTNHILSGYLTTDLNFDGKTLFTGPGNDTSLLVGNILLHPLNTGFAANYIVRGGLQ
ncbi:SdrD B-like domain-containing protein [Thiothrix winogradskyi]|uniref:GEVED domain-containing protein n=1 Tax=Thiothrix winogradskyi TaxID=96472 RepID=A0ABY3SV46_9GAMM|nr:SdrD B-like domain-containing protein [Thiothrix winogradskyi]UJS23266.1 GEVED domain-containing protein [Thiothrix winogradskyi]